MTFFNDALFNPIGKNALWLPLLPCLSGRFRRLSRGWWKRLPVPARLPYLDWMSQHTQSFLYRRERLDFRSCAEDLDQAVRDCLFLALFELPDGKAETVRVTRRPTIFGVVVTDSRVRIASAHAARAGAPA